MTQFLREFRVLPVLLVAITLLFALKTARLLLDGGYILGDVSFASGESDPGRTFAARAPKERSWAQEVLNFPDRTGAIDATGSSAAPKPAADAPPAKPKPQEPPPSPNGIPVQFERAMSAGER